jgi:hypothetical protein
LLSGSGFLRHGCGKATKSMPLLKYFLKEERIMKTLIVICGVVVLCCVSYAGAVTWNTIDKVGEVYTAVYGIDGSTLVGTYSGDGGNHGFSYNSGTWVTHDNPAGQTALCGIDGSNYVGIYYDTGWHGLLYDGTTWTPLNAPGAVNGTYINGIDGGNLVGYYLDSFSNEHGVLYNGGSWTIIDKPGAIDTRFNGISGNKLVGGYDSHGVIYDMTGGSWTIYDKPGAFYTCINGISGSNLVGYYGDISGDHGFFYNGTSWTTLDFPGAAGTYVYGIDGSNLAGYYWNNDGLGYPHGFTAIIPEPMTLALLGLGSLMLRKRKA